MFAQFAQFAQPRSMKAVTDWSDVGSSRHTVCGRTRMSAIRGVNSTHTHQGLIRAATGAEAQETGNRDKKKESFIDSRRPAGTQTTSTNVKQSCVIAFI